jgi:Kef-type K+ transport system membrane component KefB
MEITEKQRAIEALQAQPERATIVVLNIGLDLGIISPALFTMMVLMAVATTIATTPMLDLVGPARVRYNRPV